MNFLAHLTLSHFSADLQVGNFLGDLLRGSEVDDLPPGIRRGVEMHRAIDFLTDADPDVRALNALLRGRHGRYAPVISDVAFDHFLYRNWAELGPEPFADFTERTYARMAAARAEVPARARVHIDGLVRHAWLAMYATPDGMRGVFRRMRPRLSRPEMLRGVDVTLQELSGPFNRTLLLLFPRLQQLADTYRE